MSGPIRIVGLGPAGLDRVAPAARAVLDEHAVPVVGRSIDHPAARELSERRPVVWCDDLYESQDAFDDVYGAIAARVIDLAATGPVTYAVPGSALVGEIAVGRIRREAADRGIPVETHPGESFLDLSLERVGMDPFDRGMQVIDAHRLPEPLLLHLPTFIVQLDGPGAFTAVHERLTRLLEPATPVTILRDVGSPDEQVEVVPLGDLRPEHAGLRVTLFIDVDPPGWPGLVQTNALLRRECPWDREQTHHSLARHLLEEAYETLDAIEALPMSAPEGEIDAAAYVELEEELGDLLLQVVFHATLAAETDAFGVEEVAEAIRRKLVRRHPHVFGDVDADTADEVLGNWEARKREEKGRESLLDGVPTALPALTRALEFQARAASVGFDWPDLGGVVTKVREEIDEVVEAPTPEAARDEVGDLLFSVVNLARRLDLDPEAALRAAADRFSSRFRHVERSGDVTEMTLEQMDAAWDDAKRREEEGQPGSDR
jgi:tetrapyrrole methylase family protein/MazG family protein